MFLGVACQCVLFYWICEANALSMIIKEAFCFIELFAIRWASKQRIAIFPPADSVFVSDSPDLSSGRFEQGLSTSLWLQARWKRRREAHRLLLVSAWKGRKLGWICARYISSFELSATPNSSVTKLSKMYEPELKPRPYNAAVLNLNFVLCLKAMEIIKGNKVKADVSESRHIWSFPERSK